MKAKTTNNAGMALMLVLISIVVVLGALVISGQLVTSTRRGADTAIEMHMLDEACKSGVDIAVERLWNQYVIGNGNTTGNLASYKLFIDGVVPTDGSLDLLGGDGMVLNEQAGVLIDSIMVARTDDIDGVLLTTQVTASARSGDADEVRRQRVEQSMRIGGEPFSGFEYAVLANNINCILCHAGIYPLTQRLNTDPEQIGNFDRVKVATLEALLYRPGAADSRVAGTIYTRGQVYNERWQPRTPAQIVASTNLVSFDFSTDDGKLSETDDGNLIGPVPLRHGSTDAQGRPEQFASLYTDYPTDPNLMTDGPLPAVFPPPFPDHNENRHVDDDEFEEVAQVLNGEVTGGTAYGVPAGDFYGDPSLPAGSNDALNTLAATGRYDGNLVLVGTQNNPIRINGEVAINGDLLIQGPVQGRGQLFVRGNTYITGDVVYNDAPDEFGVASDGTENALAIVTGGSVLMGDYLTIRGKQHREDTSQYPDWGTGTILARVANQRNQSPQKNGTREWLDRGYFDPGVIDAGEIVDTMIDNDGNVVPRQGQQFSFTQSELMLFNNLELQKALNDANYTPRFYGIRDTQPNNIYLFTRTNATEHAVKYNDNGVILLTDHLINLGIDPTSILDRAAFHYMNPTDHWIDEETLRQIWWDDEMQRDRGDIWRFDGLLYSNNAIFTITRSHRRKGSHTEGKMEVRGAIICPDLGVLTPGPDRAGEESFTLLYDPRVRDFWAPHDTNRAFFQRLVYRIIPVEAA